MSETPYFQKEYHEPNTNIPNPNFSQIMHDFFLAPFKWNARATRKEFWIGYAIQFVLSSILGILAVASIFLFATVDTNNTGWSPAVIRVTVTVVILETIYFLLLLWIKLGLLGSAVRRLHDSNHEGWWIWLRLVPFGWIIILYLLVLPTLEHPVKWNGYLYTTKN